MSMQAATGYNPERLAMFSQNDDDYRTCKHESFHILRALSTGNRVLSVDITKGKTFLQWCAFPWEMPRLVRTDPTYAVGLVQGIIGTCIAPALAAREPLNPGDEAAYRPFLTAWPRSAPVTRDELYRQACAETRAWLDLSETKQQVRKMAERLFVHRDSVIEGDLLHRILASVTEQPAPQTAAPALSPRRMVPDYPVGVLDDVWFRTHTKQTTTAPAPESQPITQPAPARGADNWGRSVRVLIARVA